MTSLAPSPFYRALNPLMFALAALFAPMTLDAQRADSVRAGAARRASAPPISPRRAFLYSLAVPGLGQASLDRGTSGTVFFLADVTFLALSRKTLNDLHVAKRLPRDTLTVAFQPNPRLGTRIVDPLTGDTISVRCPRSTTIGPPFLDEESNLTPAPIRCLPRGSADLVRARRTHYEDWIALMIFNHLISGAEAFVSAHLWDLPAQVSVRPSVGVRGASVSAHIAW